MDFILFLFLETIGLFLLIYGMGFHYYDIRVGLTFISTMVFHMLSVAAWDITRDFSEVVSINATDVMSVNTIHYVIPEMSQFNVMLMWISVLWIFFKVLYNAEEILSVLKFRMSSLSRKVK